MIISRLSAKITGFAFAAIFVAGFSIAIFPETPAEMGTRMSAEQDSQPKFHKVKAEIDLKIYGSDGALKFTKKMIIAQYTKDLGAPNEIEYSISYFKEPADDRGNAYLAYNYKDREDDKFVYLKGIRKAKKVAGASKKSPFFGSDFFNNDMAFPDLRECTYRHIGKQKVSFKGREFECDMVEFMPVSESMKSEIGYGKKIYYYRKADNRSYLTLKVDYYDENLALFKVLTLKSFITGKNVKGETVFYTTGLEMKNVQTGSRTELFIKNVQVEGAANVSPEIFNVDNLDKKWW